MFTVVLLCVVHFELGWSALLSSRTLMEAYRLHWTMSVLNPLLSLIVRFPAIIVASIVQNQ